MLVLRLIASSKQRAAGGGTDAGSPGKGGRRRGADDGPPAAAGELMMSCAVCGVHLPASEAVFARGKVFCGREHRDSDEARRDGA
jgi:uncharacterized protein